MRFVETPVFTAQITNLLSDDDYSALQAALVLRPGAGAISPGSGGIRKLRWRREGVGKRGGLRILYYWHVRDDVIYMLLTYSKARQEDVTPQQMMMLRRVVKEALEWTDDSSKI